MKWEDWKLQNDYEQALRNLNGRAWSIMEDWEKLQDLQAIEDYTARLEGRLPAQVSAADLDAATYGKQVENNIVLNQNVLDSDDYMENVGTVFHEGKHVKDYQANFVESVRQQYTAEELERLNQPVPAPETDPAGYWNHPAEQGARLAEEQGKLRVESDQQIIRIIDHQREVQGKAPRNQILETHDYLALAPMSDPPEMNGRVSLGGPAGLTGPDADTKGVSETASPEGMPASPEGCSEDCLGDCPEDGGEGLSDDGGLSL